jgi:hypothetical protein
VKQSEATQKEVSVGWLRERDELKSNAFEMTRKVDQLQEQLNGRVREVDTLVGTQRCDWKSELPLCQRHTANYALTFPEMVALEINFDTVSSDL